MDFTFSIWVQESRVFWVKTAQVHRWIWFSWLCAIVGGLGTALFVQCQRSVQSVWRLLILLGPWCCYGHSSGLGSLWIIRDDRHWKRILRHFSCSRFQRLWIFQRLFRGAIPMMIERTDRLVFSRSPRLTIGEAFQDSLIDRLVLLDWRNQFSLGILILQFHFTRAEIRRLQLLWNELGGCLRRHHWWMEWSDAQRFLGTNFIVDQLTNRWLCLSEILVCLEFQLHLIGAGFILYIKIPGWFRWATSLGRAGLSWRSWDFPSAKGPQYRRWKFHRPWFSNKPIPFELLLLATIVARTLRFNLTMSDEFLNLTFGSIALIILISILFSQI